MTSLISIYRVRILFGTKQFKDSSRSSKDTFPIFKDSIQCKKEPWVYVSFSSSTTWVFYTRPFCVCSFSFKLKFNYKVCVEIQRLSSTNCNFQGLSRPWILVLKFKDFQGVCDPCIHYIQILHWSPYISLKS